MDGSHCRTKHFEPKEEFFFCLIYNFLKTNLKVAVKISCIILVCIAVCIHMVHTYQLKKSMKMELIMQSESNIFCLSAKMYQQR